MKKRFLCAALAALLISFSLSGCAVINAAAAPGEVEEFQTGKIDGNSYSNEFFGIGCELDDTWTVLSEEEIAERSGLVFDTMEQGGMDDSARKAMENGNMVFDFFAQKTDNSAAINVSVGNIGILYGTAMTEEGYVDATTEQIVESVETIGYSNVTTEKTTVTLAGAEHAALNLSGDYSGIPIYQTLVVLRKGLYVECIAFTSGGEDTSSDLAALFYALDQK
ncbi:MAG: hypothetical protein ABFC73_12450 [Clostridiaceae bacterium]